MAFRTFTVTSLGGGELSQPRTCGIPITPSSYRLARYKLDCAGLRHLKLGACCEGVCTIARRVVGWQANKGVILEKKSI